MQTVDYTPETLDQPLEKPEKHMSVFEYKRPEELASKTHVPIARSDIMYCAVQVVTDGGETNMHSHEGMDGLWFVLKGRVRFYNKDKLVGEFGQHQGVFVPRGVAYWFESVGDEPLEILQAEAIDRRGSNRRTDFAARTRKGGPSKVVKGAFRPV